jgi:hypothetical protein
MITLSNSANTTNTTYITKQINDESITKFILTNEFNNLQDDFHFVAINDKTKLKKISKIVNANDTNGGTNLTANDNTFMVCLYDKLTNDINDIVSFVNFTFIDREIAICATTGKQVLIPKYIYINFSFTFVKYRQQGYNSLMRKFIEDICKEFDIPCIMSCPFEGANSPIVLKKLGYQTDIDEKIYYKFV